MVSHVVITDQEVKIEPVPILGVREKRRKAGSHDWRVYLALQSWGVTAWVYVNNELDDTGLQTHDSRTKRVNRGYQIGLLLPVVHSKPITICLALLSTT